MEKRLLIETRIKKGLTQQQLADSLCMDVSNYNRKEKGSVKIRHDEWEKLAKALSVEVEEIYESDDSHYVVFREHSVGNYQGTNNIYSIPEYFLEMQRKYIEKLEEEIKHLKEKKSY
ncbi:MAG: helix-turn-helix transcriptional regulator [Flammeovirgaceae bacterium]